MRDLAKVNRAFVLKAVQWAGSMLGIGQFLDLGCGLPSAPAVHDAARAGREGARVVYVDTDPVAVCHAMHLQSGDGLAALQADVSAPAVVLGDRVVRRLIDFRQPACAVFGATLSAMGAETAREAVAGYAAALAAGSAIVISCASWADPAAGQAMAEAYSAAGEWHNHSLADVASFFAGLRIIHGRVMDLGCWPACPATPQEPPPAAVLGGIGVTP